MKYDLSKAIDFNAIATDTQAWDEALTAAEANDPSALFVAHNIFRDGYGVKGGIDGEKAHACLRHAAKTEHPLAVGNFGWYLLHDVHYKSNPPLGKKLIAQSAGWVKKQAAMGHVYAMLLLSHYHCIDEFKLEGIDFNYEKAEMLMRKAAQAGELGAHHYLALYIHNEKANAVAPQATALANFSSVASEFAKMPAPAFGVQSGNMTSFIHNNAVKDAFLVPANAGHVRAQSNLGRLYTVVLDNRAEAIKWMIKAAQQGSLETLFALGAYYDPSAPSSRIDRKTTSESLSFEYYRQGAEKGDLECTLGYIAHLANPNGMHANRALAYECVIKTLVRDGKTVSDWPPTESMKNKLWDIKMSLEKQATEYVQSGDTYLDFPESDFDVAKMPREFTLTLLGRQGRRLYDRWQRTRKPVRSAHPEL